MGTNGGGLARYRDGTFTRVTRADGLPSDLVRSLYQDADGWLWVGTEGRGLARLDPRAWGDGDRDEAGHRPDRREGRALRRGHPPDPRGRRRPAVDEHQPRDLLGGARGAERVRRGARRRGSTRRRTPSATACATARGTAACSRPARRGSTDGSGSRRRTASSSSIRRRSAATSVAPPLVVEQVVAGGTRASPGARLDRAPPRPARPADRVHRAHVPRAGERPLPLPARSVRRRLGRRREPPHGLLHEGAAGPIHVPRRGERRRRRVVRAGDRGSPCESSRGSGRRASSAGRRSRR